MTLALDASVGLKWVLNEPDSHVAQALAAGAEALIIPDFWLNEACNVLWLQVRKGMFSETEAREGLSLLTQQLKPTPTSELALHDIALDIGLAVGHSTYETLSIAFALAFGARGLVVADRPFAEALRRHPDPVISALPLSLSDWARQQGL